MIRGTCAVWKSCIGYYNHIWLAVARIHTVHGTANAWQAGHYKNINFSNPPRGILTLDDATITKSAMPDADYPGDAALAIQSGGQRWKLCSEVPGEIDRWEKVSFSPVAALRLMG